MEAAERYSLSGRLHERGGEREYRFLFRDKPRLLPLIREGQFQIVRWGRRRGEAGKFALHRLSVPLSEMFAFLAG